MAAVDGHGTAKRSSPGSGSDEPGVKRLRTGMTEEEHRELGLGHDQVALLALDGGAVKKLKVVDVQRWVAAVLIAGGQEGSIEEETSDVGEVVAVLKKQKVTGAALVKLTLEKLLAAPYSLAGGPAEVLAARIAELTKEERELCFRNDQVAPATGPPQADAVYTAVLNATLAPDANFPEIQLLKLSDGRPWFGLEPGGALPCDTVVACRWMSQLWEARKKTLAQRGCVLCGSPSARKSTALNYFLYQYLTAAAKDDKSVVHKRCVALILPTKKVYHLFDTQTQTVRTFRIGEHPAWDGCGELCAFEKDLFILHDLGRDAPLTPDDVPTIVATSPKYSKYNEFKKGINSDLVYVPLPSDDEMECFAAKVSGDPYKNAWPSEVCTTWRQVAYYHGNAPRHVFGKKDAGELDRQLEGLKLEDVANIQSDATVNVNDRLVELVPTDGGERCTYRFRPGYVTEFLAQKFLVKQLQEWDRIVHFTNCGHPFEQVLHEFLAKFPTKLAKAEMRRLGPGGTGEVTTDLDGFWPTSGEEWQPIPFTSEGQYELHSGRYYYPLKPNLAVIDSFVFRSNATTRQVKLFGLQMTINPTRHPSTESKLCQMLDDLARGFWFQAASKGRHALKIEEKDGKLTVAGLPGWTVDVHLIFVVQHPNLFAYQGLKDVTRMGSFWSQVKQYSTPPPAVGM